MFEQCPNPLPCTQLLLEECGVCGLSMLEGSPLEEGDVRSPSENVSYQLMQGLCRTGAWSVTEKQDGEEKGKCECPGTQDILCQLGQGSWKLGAGTALLAQKRGGFHSKSYMCSFLFSTLCGSLNQDASELYESKSSSLVQKNLLQGH